MVKPQKKPIFGHVAIFMSYFKALKVLLESQEKGLDLVRIYLFKHCLELISRALIDPDCKSHSLKSFSNEIIKRFPHLLREWEEFIDLTDEGLLDFKKRVEMSLLTDLNWVEQYGFEGVKKILNLVKPPRINAKHLHKILAKYDFWDSNNTYFRYFDSYPHKVGGFKTIEEITDSIKQDVSFLKECENFLSFIFLSEYETPLQKS